MCRRNSVGASGNARGGGRRRELRLGCTSGRDSEILPRRKLELVNGDIDTRRVSSKSASKTQIYWYFYYESSSPSESENFYKSLKQHRWAALTVKMAMRKYSAAWV